VSLLDLPLRALLDEVAARGRTPGSGSVAALVTAAAAGLLAKVARFSGDGWPEAPGIAAQAEALRDRAAPLAQTDADEYEAALRAHRDNTEDPGERRDFALGRAFARAAEPPLEIAAIAADVARLSVTVAERGEPALRADAVSAALFAAAAAATAAELVAVNLTASDTDERVTRARRLAEEAAEAAEEARTALH
jgi:formiminotetrahydrofolate cyclodeaminase